LSFGLQITDPQSEIQNPWLCLAPAETLTTEYDLRGRRAQSPIRNPRSKIHDPKSEIENLKSSMPWGLWEVNP